MEWLARARRKRNRPAEVVSNDRGSASLAEDDDPLVVVEAHRRRRAEIRRQQQQQPLLLVQPSSSWKNTSQTKRVRSSSVDDDDDDGALVHHRHYMGQDPVHVPADILNHPGDDAVGGVVMPPVSTNSIETVREKQSSWNAASTSIAGHTTTAAPKKLVILPLVPQHVQKRRRLEEILAQHPHNNDRNTSSHSLSILQQQQRAFLLYRDRPRPARYPRRRHRGHHIHQHSNTHATFTANKDYDEDHRRLGENPDNYTTTQQRQQQQRRTTATTLSTDPQQVVGLYQGYGTHYVDLWVGTPPQRQTLIVDTGSATTAFPCSGCTRERCGPLVEYHTDGPFQEQYSSTFAAVPCEDCVLGHCSNSLENSRPAQCTFGVSYQEGSNWTAFEAMDQVYVGGMHTQALERKNKNGDQQQQKRDGLDPLAAPEFSFPLRFGCQTQMSGHFRTQLEDGIVGMDIGRAAIWNQMYLQGRIASRAFSLCFQRQTARHASGALTLGGTDPRLHNSDNPMVYAERAHSEEEGAVFFSARLRRVHLREGGGEGNSVLHSKKKGGGGDRLKIIPVEAEDFLNGRDGLVIIDSGTTDTYLTHLLQEPFQRAWLELTGGRGYHNKPMAVPSEEDLDRMPTILLQFQGHVESNEQVQRAHKPRLKSLPLAGELDPEHPYDVLLAIPPSHYMEYQPDTHTYVAGFYFDEPEGSVLGANAMMLHDILFDVEHERIGWAESTCEYNTLVAPFLEHATNSKNAKPYHAPNPRMRGPPGSRTKKKDNITYPVVAEIPVGGVARMSSGISVINMCSSHVCRVSLAVVTIVLALGSVFALILRRRRRRGCIDSLSPCTLNSVVLSNGTSIAMGSGPYITSPVAPPPRRGGKRRSSNLTRSTSEAIARSALIAPGSVALSSDDGGSSNDESIPIGPPRFTRGQILRSRSNCHH